MIAAKRAKKPGILVRNFLRWEAGIRAATTKVGRDNAVNKYRQKEIKDTLEGMFHDKCAYCEANITHVAYSHIEHYRPKDRYPLKAIEWNNLLLACGICNGPEHKGTHFPTPKNNGPIIDPTEKGIDLSLHFEFHYDEKAGIAIVNHLSNRGEVTKNLLGLNRKKLVRHRSAHVKKLVAIARMAKTDAEAHTILLEAITDESEYSAFAKMVFLEYFTK